MKTDRLPLVAGLVVLVLSLSHSGCSISSDSASSSSPSVPQFTLNNLDGKSVSMKDFGNKVVLIDFWATWCGPCREEIPDLNNLYSEYKSKGFEVIGISMDTEGTDVVKDFVREFRVDYSIVMGDETVAQEFGGILGLPTKFIVDRNGKIVKRLIGLRPPEEIEQAIKELI
ncbi:MAG: TlpA disulfide reductase family protein [Acidobacteriota bacterium]